MTSAQFIELVKVVVPVMLGLITLAGSVIAGAKWIVGRLTRHLDKQDAALERIAAKQGAADIWTAETNLRLVALEKQWERQEVRIESLEGWASVPPDERRPFARARKRDA